MRPLIKILHQLLKPAAHRFQQALQHPDQVQQQVQKRLLERLKASVYGQSLGLQTLTDWSQIPIVTYTDLHPWIQQQRQHRQSLLTPDPVLFYEQTSGSEGAIKWIPYTRALRQSFNHLFCVWAYDLIEHGPPFQTGRSYISITPAFTAAGQSPEGLQDDSDYLDSWLQWLLSPFLITISGAQTIRDINTFKHQLSLALLQADTLEVLSIWSPTFLLLHLNYIQAHADTLKTDLGSRISRQRHQLLTQDPIPWTELWPQLKLISSWDQAHATAPAQALRQIFPTVMVQGKGLLATEAPITVPWIPAQGCVPLLDEIFLEFEDDQGHIHGLQDLQMGSRYAVIVSQMGGFYRYRLGDWIQVTGKYQQTPCLTFIGRLAQTSDLVGEKLHETFVQTALAQIPTQGSRFRCLVPCLDPDPHYLLLVDQITDTGQAMVHALDQALQASPHYQLARQLGQLGSVQIRISSTLIETLMQVRSQGGRPWGSIKLPTLWTEPLPLDLFSGSAQQSHRSQDRHDHDQK